MCIRDSDGICDSDDVCPNDPENDSDGDGICESDEIFGCTDILACNYNTLATENNNSCLYAVNCDTCSGENDGSGSIIDNDTDNDGICDADEIEGCTDAMACNYNPMATEENGLCEFADQYYDCSGFCLNDSDGDGICNELEIFGCTDTIAFNYNVEATEDDNSCIAVVLGCINPVYLEYNASANTNDGSCSTLVVLGLSLIHISEPTRPY